MDNYQEIICFICGKQYIIGCFKGHLKKCEKKFNSDQEKLSESEKIKCPLPPLELNRFFSTDKFSKQDFEAYMQKMQKKFHKQPKSRSVQKQNPNLQKIKKKISMNQQFRKPRTLVCPVCGRQFGLTSLKIHHPQCIEKFNNQQNKKLKGERRQLPILDKTYEQMIQNKQQWKSEEIQDFNNHSMQVYRDKGLVKCFNCQRSFFVEALEKHKKNCVLINGKKNNNSMEIPKLVIEQFIKPKVLMCYICGRQFGTMSLLIHQKVCVQKYLNQERKKPKQDQRGLPQVPNQIKQKFDVQNVVSWTNQKIEEFNKIMFDIYNSKALEPCPHCGRTFFHDSLIKHLKGCSHNKSKSQPKLEIIQQQVTKPKTLVCYICGRQFGLTSLTIHQPQCLVKYNNQQSKKQIFKRKALPEIDQKFRQMILQSNWTTARIQQFNKYMGQIYKKLVLQKCENCGRTFNPDSLLKHIKNCKLISKPSIEKSRDSKSNKSFKRQKIQYQKNQFQSQIMPLQHIQVKKISKIEEISSDLESSDSKNQKIQTQSKTRNLVTNKMSFSVSTPQLQQLLNKKQKKQNLKANQYKVSQKLKRSDTGLINQNNKLLKNQSFINLTDRSSVYQINHTKSNLNMNKDFLSKSFKDTTKITQINVEECKYCKRGFDTALISKHLLMCFKRKKQQKIQVKKTDKNENFQRRTMYEKQSHLKQNQNQVEQTIMQTCKKCLRKYNKAKIQNHYNICKVNKGDNQSQKNLKNKSFNQLQKRIQTQPQQNIENLQFQKLIQCKLCKRKFKQDRILKHQTLCQKADIKNLSMHINKPKNQVNLRNTVNITHNVQINITTEQVNLNLSPCKKCGKKFPNNRINEHQLFCKFNKNQTKINMNNISSNNNGKNISLLSKGNNQKQIKQINIPKLGLDQNKKKYQEQKLEICQKCSKNFSKDAMSKHITICKGENKLHPRQNIKRIGTKSFHQTNPITQNPITQNIDTEQGKDQKMKYISNISTDRLKKKNELTSMNKSNNNLYQPRAQEKKDLHLPQNQK